MVLNITDNQLSHKYSITLNKSFLIVGSHHEIEILLIQEFIILEATIIIFLLSNSLSGSSSLFP